MQAIIVQTFIAAPPETIWAALTSRADVLFDGLPASAWPTREEQAPLHFTAPWPFTQAAGGPTNVAVTLHTLGGGTRLDLRHEGWGEGGAWDEAIQGHFAGWLHGLAALGHLIETGGDARVKDSSLKGAQRYLVSGEVPAGAAAVWRALTDPAVLGRWSEGALDGLTSLESVEDKLVRWRTGAGELVAILRATPRGTHVALAEYGIAGQDASARWPAMFERLSRFLG